MAVNGKRQPSPPVEKGYLVLSRKWKTGDRVELNLPMPIERIAANPQVKENVGQLALQRGPLVYCVEACDNPESLDRISLPAEAELKANRDPSILGGMMVIQGTARIAPESDWTRKLYQPAPSLRGTPLKAIPYYAWDNRKAGAMKVWLPVAPPPAKAGTLEARAKLDLSFRSDNARPEGINDGVEPKSSGDQPAALCHWWPHKGTTEWVQYSWPNAVKLSGAKVYWFDDTGRGECRLPASWSVEYLDGSTWKPVKHQGDYPVKADQWCEARFDAVSTTSVRLKVNLKDQWAAGAHEWQVVEDEE